MYTTSQRALPSLRSFVAAAGLATSLTLVGTAAFAQGVVTLETPPPPGSEQSTSPDAQPTPPSDPQEAMLAYVECMRDHGVDMPDPEFTADGGVIMRMNSSADDDDGGPTLVGGPGDPEFSEAQEACGSLMEGTVRDIDPEQVARAQAEALAFAQCMREHGIDMPDPQFTADGGMSIAIGGPDGPRIDPETMQAAQEACGGGSFGVGPGEPGAPDDAGGDDQPAATAAIP